MREIFFDENSVCNGLRQAYEKLMNNKIDLNSYKILGIGNGGTEIAKRFVSFGNQKEFVSCMFEGNEINIPDQTIIKDQNILVCDDSTITGKTFGKVVQKLIDLGARDIKLLSFLMRRNSSIVPNIFIFEIEEDTKVYFPWSDYPIRIYSKGIVRKISHLDCNKNFKCGNINIDKNTLSDFYRYQEHTSAKVYLIEDDNEICSIIQFYEKKIDKYRGLFLDTIATSEEKKGKSYAQNLLKLITYYMIYHDFDFIYGFAFDDEKLIEMYKNRGYEVIGTVQDPNYNTLYKIVIINGNEDKKNLMMPTIRSCI